MSKYTEGKIAIEAVKAVEEYGELSMGELIDILTERMKPSGHDIEIINKRNDTYFSQKVRNLRSHNNGIFFSDVYFDDAIDKYVSNEFGKLKSKADKKTYLKELRQKKSNAKKFYSKKIDYERINKEKKQIGNYGEEFVYKRQVEFVKEHFSEYVRKVRHVSRLDGDGAGYDILSFDKDKRIIYVEVKTTKGIKETPFYMSATEYEFFKMHEENYVIARVYNFDEKTKTGEIDYIFGKKIDVFFDKEVSAYKFFYKK